MSAISLISVRSHLLLVEIEITKSGNFAIICYFKLYANNLNLSISSISPKCGNGNASSSKGATLRDNFDITGWFKPSDRHLAQQGDH